MALGLWCFGSIASNRLMLNSTPVPHVVVRNGLMTSVFPRGIFDLSLVICMSRVSEVCVKPISRRSELASRLPPRRHATRPRHLGTSNAATSRSLHPFGVLCFPIPKNRPRPSPRFGADNRARLAHTTLQTAPIPSSSPLNMSAKMLLAGSEPVQAQEVSLTGA